MLFQVNIIKIIISPGGLTDNFAKIIDLNMILAYNYDGTQNKKSFKEFKLLNMAIFGKSLIFRLKFFL